MCKASKKKKALYHQLNQKYTLKKYALTIATRSWEIFSVGNIDGFLDNFITKEELHKNTHDICIPYWIDLWPSSVGLAEYILENPILLEKKKVIEIGCGLGLSGMAAAEFTDDIIMTDYFADSFPFIQLNWLHNLGRAADCRLMDWHKPDENLKPDVIIAADVAYESHAFVPLIRTFKQLLSPNGFVLLSEPGRTMAKPFLNSFSREGFHVEHHKRLVSLEKMHTEVGIYKLWLKDGFSF